MNDARPESQAETLAALWRISRAEAEDLRTRIALLERAVTRAVSGASVPGNAAAWQSALADAEAAAADTRARNGRIAALLEGRAA
jgi:hypothetical protein